MSFVEVFWTATSAAWKTHSACLDCGLVYELSRPKSRPRKRCLECAEDERNNVPWYRRRSHHAVVSRRIAGEEFKRPCLAPSSAHYLEPGAKAGALVCRRPGCRKELQRYRATGGWIGYQDLMTGKYEYIGQEDPAWREAARARRIPMRPDMAPRRAVYYYEAT
jgi:hypothetical protein